MGNIHCMFRNGEALKRERCARCICQIYRPSLKFSQTNGLESFNSFKMAEVEKVKGLLAYCSNWSYLFYNCKGKFRGYLSLPEKISKTPFTGWRYSENGKRRVILKRVGRALPCLWGDLRESGGVLCVELTCRGGDAFVCSLKLLCFANLLPQFGLLRKCVSILLQQSEYHYVNFVFCLRFCACSRDLKRGGIMFVTHDFYWLLVYYCG